MKRGTPGMDELVRILRPYGPAPVVMAATGGSETPLSATLTAAGFPVASDNPLWVRLRQGLWLDKKDQLDAQTLAEFAAAVRPSARPIPDARLRELQEMVT